MAEVIRRKMMVIILMLTMVISLMLVMTLNVSAVDGEPAAVTETADFMADAARAIALLGGSERVGYNIDNNEITLKGVDFSTSASVAVRLPDDVKLVLENGTINRITSTYNNGSGPDPTIGIESQNLTIDGTGTLEVISGIDNNNIYISKGISASSLTILGGTVIATGGDGGEELLRGSVGIYASESVIVSGGTVTAMGGKALYDSWGIDAKDISVSGNSIITAIGGEAEVSCGIAANESFEITGGTVTAAGKEAPSSIGIAAKSVTVTGGQLAATSADADHASCAITGEYFITISGGTVNATSEMVTTPEGMSIAMAAMGSIEISGGTVTAIGDTQALFSVPVLADYVYYSAAGARSISGGEPVSPEPYNTENNSEYKYVNIKPLRTITAAGVTGITAPAVGMKPASVGSLMAVDESYTVSDLIWQSSDGSAAVLTAEGNFKAASTYQASIELTAAVGYKFESLTPTVNAGTATAGTIDADREGNKLTFTVIFSTTGYAPVAGFGNALDFSVDERIDVPYNDSNKLAGDSDFTISMWIFPEAETGRKTLYRQFGSIRGSLGVWLRYEYDEHSQEGYLYFGFDKFDTDGWQWAWPWSDGIPSDVTKFPLYQWAHIALTKSGNIVKTYINGAEDYEMTLDPARASATAPSNENGKIGIGGDTDGNNYFDGRIDEVQFWNKALTQQEIEAWMYREIDGTHSKYGNLIFYYSLNQNSGNNVIDSKGVNDGNTVNMTGGNWVSSDISGWTVNAGTTINGMLVGSDIDGTSTDGMDWGLLTFEIVTQSEKGTVTIPEDNQFTYTANIDGDGSDTFTYKVIDGDEIESNVQTVKINIIPVEFSLIYTAGENGSIMGNASQTIKYGENGTAVTAVPDTGYHFIRWSDGVTTATRMDENVMGNISVTAEFTAIEPQPITAIAVKTQPTKLTYIAGETLDLAGLKATLTYSDGSTVDVAYAQFGVNGITAHPDQGTIMEVAIHNGQAIMLTCNTHTVRTSDLTVTATPVTVPGVPTNVTATAGNGQVTVSFTPPADNGGSAITGYSVTSNPGNITAEGSGTTITVTGLSNGTAYTFTVTASNAAGTGPASEASNAVTPYRPSSGNSDRDSTSLTPPAGTGVDIFVNGKTETAATATTTQEGDKTITAIVVDDKKVEKRLEQEGNNAVVTIPVNNGADVVIGTLNGRTVKNMESKDAVLEIKTGQVTYTLPACQINIDAVSGQIGKQVELNDIAVSIKISEPAADTVKIVEDTADKNNYQIIVKPIEFEITCSSGSKTVEVSKFSAYVERMIAIPEGIDPSKITTGVILNSNGTFSHVPTVITMIDGKYYAKINSLTNSTYVLIYSPKTFKDVERHWAEKDVDDMASRLVVSGVGNDEFEPDRDITRAEFAAIVVRALGLMRPETGRDVFSDVPKDAWYYDAVAIAYEYDLITGYGSGQFGPVDKITREQAMTMVARAMNITNVDAKSMDSEAMKVLAGFIDANSAADYAKAGIAACVKTGIISGRSKTTLAPKDDITRAEVAVILRRLLQQAGLI